MKSTLGSRIESVLTALGNTPGVAGYLGRRLHERVFDWRYGVDTGGRIDACKLDGAGEHRLNSRGYDAIQIPLFMRMMSSLRVDPARFAFVDLGSGKGRAIMLAARSRFKHVVGVELSPELHEIASRNVKTFRRRCRQPMSIELRCQDVIHWRIPDEDMVCLLYNPFDEVVMAKMVQRFEAWRMDHPERRLLLLYRNARHARLIAESRVFASLVVTRDYHVFEAPVGKQDALRDERECGQ